MESFSERIGAVPKRSVVQLDSMDNALRVGLWNAVTQHYFTPFVVKYGAGAQKATDPLKSALPIIWDQLLHLATDTIPDHWPGALHMLREWYFAAKWNAVYDLVEFLPRAVRDSTTNAAFRKSCNAVLEREMSAYRFVGGQLARVTDPAEAQSVAEALALPKGYRVASQHITTALARLSDRDAPDYRNSIKESISAVESVAALVTGQTKSDLGAALARLQATAGLHPALKSAFLVLYGYTNNDNGIRHALLDEANLTHDDAKFMLVACSAFVNYVKALTADGRAKRV